MLWISRGNATRSGVRRLTALAVAIVAAAACKSTTGGGGMSTTSVAGIVTDSTGAVLSGVAVTAGSSTTTTGANGTFSFASSPQASLVIDFSKTGYLESSKQVTVTAGTTSNVVAALMALAPPQPLDATKGGSITGTRGSSLKADPSVLVDATGKAVSGSVDVSLTPLSPAVPGELAAYPGSLVGSTNGATPSLLRTYGVLDVTVTQNGQPVQVASGHTVTVTIPVAASGTLPKTEDLWSYNLTTGIWDHEGTAQLSGSTYTAELSHFSYHNIDAAVLTGQATCVTGLVVNSSGQPVSGAYVSPTQGASVDTLITTDSTGRYCTWLLTGTSETITADATSAPYGEGTVTVTGGAAVPFPGSESCSNVNCATAPNIVLDQPPCKTDSDCPSDDTCCAVKGQNMCLESFACQEAVTGSPSGVSTCSSDSNCMGGDVCCTVETTSTKTCLPMATCNLVSHNPCGSGAITATIGGETYAFNCYVAESVGSEGMEGLILDGSVTGSTTGASVQIEFSSKDDFAGFTSGKTFPLGADGGQGPVQVIVDGKDKSGATVEVYAVSGSVTLNQWSDTSGGQLSITIADGTMLSGVSIGADGGEATVTGTVSGTATATVEAVP
jgi:Carboxypeptidase regulatory-like domain